MRADLYVDVEYERKKAYQESLTLVKDQGVADVYQQERTGLVKELNRPENTGMLKTLRQTRKSLTG